MKSLVTQHLRQLPVGPDCLLQVGAELLAEPEVRQSLDFGPKTLLVCGKGVPETLRDRVFAELKSLTADCRLLTLADDESDKTLQGAGAIFDALLEYGCGRDSTLVALGGGVTGDMVGFAAACYQRGIAWINLPTTLLAQADACIGGKTGVNHRLGKNMIGAFHPPSAVLADVGALDSLPDRQIGAGLAEIIKHALIADTDFLDWLEKALPQLLRREREALSEAVFRSCQIKAAIVERDPTERGDRALLNFGHSFAHAIETHQNYRGLLHGEAVAVGMVLAARLSRRLLDLPEAQARRVRELVQAAGLPTEAPRDMKPDDFLVPMRRDKKVARNRMRLVLLRELGAAELVETGDEAPLRDLLSEAPSGRQKSSL